MHSCIFDLGFGFLKNFGVGLCWFVVIWSCIAYSLHYKNVSCILDAWLIIVDCTLVGLDWGLPMMLLNFARHMLMHFSCIHFFSFLLWLMMCYVLSLSLSLSLLGKLRHGTQSTQIHSSLESSSRFRFFFFWSHSPSSCLVLWREGLKWLLEIGRAHVWTPVTG